MKYKLYKRFWETFRNLTWPKNGNSKRIHKCPIVPLHLWLGKKIAVLKICYLSFLVNTTELYTWYIDSRSNRETTNKEGEFSID